MEKQDTISAFEEFTPGEGDEMNFHLRFITANYLK